MFHKHSISSSIRTNLRVEEAVSQIIPAGLTALPGKMVKVPIIEECIMHYECRVVHENEVIPEALQKTIINDAYPQGDFHRIYAGQILATYADDNAAEKQMQ